MVYQASRLFGLTPDEYELPGSRTDLISIPRGASSSIFGGWGVRI